MTDIVSDVQTYLQADSGIQELVGVDGYIGQDQAWVNGWIWDSQLEDRIEGSEKCAIVVSYAGPWGSPLEGNTVRFPAVVVDIWADPTRNEDGSVYEHDAKAKCFRIYDRVDRALHLVNRDREDGGAIFFGLTRIFSSERLADPDLQWVSDSNGARMLRGRYGITH